MKKCLPDCKHNDKRPKQNSKAENRNLGNFFRVFRIYISETLFGAF